MKDDNPKSMIIILILIWLPLCVLIFTREHNVPWHGKIVISIILLWVMIRAAFDNGRYHPKILYALRICWLPMLVLFLYLYLIGEF